MKKVLLGSTALVAAGLIAAPSAMAAERIQVGVGGYMEQWFGYSSVDQDASTRDVDGFDVKSDSEIHFKGSTTLDNGIEFGVNVQLEANSNSGDQIDESYMIIKGSFGEINIGSENSAMYKMHYAPSDFGIGINSGDQGDWAALSGSGISNSGYFRGVLGSTYIEPNRANDSEKLTYYTPRFAGFQIGASYSPDTNQDNNGPVDRNTGVSDMVAFGLNYTGDFSGVSIGASLGYGTFLESASGTNEPEAINAGLTIGFGGFGIGGSWANADDSNADGDAYNLGVSYSTGPFGVSLTYFNGDVEGGTEQNTYHLSGKYALGPGVSANATLGYAEFESNTGAEIDATYLVTGIRLSF
ncbi:MAG: porin [Alphaproteobacteria bacterium]|nr:porin [Alphaproteobacteria bacterium]